MSSIEELKEAIRRVQQIGDHDHPITIPDHVDIEDTEQLEAFESGAYLVIDEIVKALEGIEL